MKNKHNKRRNSGLLYEFLVRHISQCLLENNKKEAIKTAKIAKKYFSVGTNLNKELNLYKTVLENKVVSKESATKLLNELYAESSKIDLLKLDEEKSKIIKEINYNLDSKKVFNYNIPNYYDYAVVQTLINENKEKKLNSVDRIKLEDYLLEIIVTPDSKSVINEQKIDENEENIKFNKAVYKFTCKGFNEKILKQLSERQKKILFNYAAFLIAENKEDFKSKISEQVNEIKCSLREVKDIGVSKDKELNKKINECYKQFVSINFDRINDDKIVELLEYANLSDELEEK